MQKYHVGFVTAILVIMACLFTSCNDDGKDGIKVTSIALNKTTVSLTPGATAQLEVSEVLPKDATKKSVLWSSSNTRVATVDQTGLVTVPESAADTAKAVITAIAMDGSGSKATCTVTVVADPIPVTSITLNLSEVSRAPGATVQLEVTEVLPEDATDKTVTWSSSDENVATVDQEGLVTVASNVDQDPQVTITATANDGSGVTASCEVTVISNPTLVTSITLNLSEISLAPGATEQLSVTEILPEGAIDKTVTWSSSDNDVATVDQTGLITAAEDAANGAEVTITATANDAGGVSASCEVVIVDPTAHDPAKPVVLASFTPNAGRVRSTITIEGANFGSNLSAIKVYFNDEEAEVKSANGTSITVTTPRITEDFECELSVVVGDAAKQSFTQKFSYLKSAVVSTIWSATTPGTGMPGGIGVFTLDVDGDGNVFFTTNPTSYDGKSNQDLLCRIDTAGDAAEVASVTFDNDSGWTNRCYGLSVDKNTGILYSSLGNIATSYLIMDPADNWATQSKNFEWDETGNASRPTGAGNYMGYNMYNKKLYTHYASGELVEIDPATNKGKVIHVANVGSGAMSYDFDPNDPDWCYMGINANTSPNGIFRFRISDPAGTWEMLNGGATGYKDGAMADASFKNIWGVRFNSEGLLYICDVDNRCVRRYDPKSGMVETVAGIPGTQGTVDGEYDVATFNTPTYLGFDNEGNVYVSDRNSNLIRKITEQ